jgi:hypothetical protein
MATIRRKMGHISPCCRFGANLLMLQHGGVRSIWDVYDNERLRNHHGHCAGMKSLCVGGCRHARPTQPPRDGGDPAKP